MAVQADLAAVRALLATVLRLAALATPQYGRTSVKRALRAQQPEPLGLAPSSGPPPPAARDPGEHGAGEAMPAANQRADAIEIAERRFAPGASLCGLLGKAAR